MDTQPRVLIVDDEEIVLDVCRQILEGSHYTVATAPDGTVGMKVVGEFQPDLVLVDLKMPGMSGFEVLERIRALDPSIVTIVITGYATVASAVEAMQKGAYDFIPKPFTPEELRLIIRRGIERRRLQQEAAALRGEKELLRENFAAIIAHELRSPLATVQQNLSVLATELSDGLTETQKTRLERIRARLGDLLGMIHTWLRAVSTDIASIREGFRPTAVALVIAKAVESVLPHARRKDVGIVTEVPEQISPVLGDEGTLVEAVVNLTTNAVKYSYPGSRVVVCAREQAGQVLIAVSDSGVGISPEELPRILAGFYRGQAGTADEAGAGLGLALTRRIVEVHQGTITAESAPGKGSTFTMALPALRAGAEARPAPEAGAQRGDCPGVSPTPNVCRAAGAPRSRRAR